MDLFSNPSTHPLRKCRVYAKSREHGIFIILNFADYFCILKCLSLGFSLVNMQTEAAADVFFA